MTYLFKQEAGLLYGKSSWKGGRQDASPAPSESGKVQLLRVWSAAASRAWFLQGFILKWVIEGFGELPVQTRAIKSLVFIVCRLLAVYGAPFCGITSWQLYVGVRLVTTGFSPLPLLPGQDVEMKYNVFLRGAECEIGSWSGPVVKWMQCWEGQGGFVEWALGQGSEGFGSCGRGTGVKQLLHTRVSLNL